MGQKDEQNTCIAVTLDSEASTLKKTDGTEIPFSRAVLGLRNTCAGPVNEVQMHIDLGQEGGTVQDVSHALAGTPRSLSAGQAIRVDVFDRLLPAHSGTSSRLHMFGYRAVLNWNFDLLVWAEYRKEGSAEQERTPACRWTLTWSVPDQSTGSVAVKIEKKLE